MDLAQGRGMRPYGFLLATTVLASCAPHESTSEPLEERPVIEEAEPMAFGVLDFLNGPDSTVEVLDVDVGLDVRAAENIVAHVRGGDAQLGTADDDLLQTTAELDAIAYVGESALAKLADYVSNVSAVPDLVVEGVGLTNAQADAIVALVNESSLSFLDEEVGLDHRAAEGLVERRPFDAILEVAEVAYVGAGALTKLRDHLPPLGPGPAEPGCALTGGTYDGTSFTADEECKAVRFANRARYSQMGGVPGTTRHVLYDCHAENGAMVCTGFRASSWNSLAEITIGVGPTGMAALKSASAAWVDDGGPTYDTIANVWANRASLADKPVAFEKVWGVVRVGSTDWQYNTYACAEVRDTPDSPNYLTFCALRIGADSSPACDGDPCIDQMVGRYTRVRGTLRRTNELPGGYKVNLLNSSTPGAPDPAIP